MISAALATSSIGSDTAMNTTIARKGTVQSTPRAGVSRIPSSVSIAPSCCNTTAVLTFERRNPRLTRTGDVPQIKAAVIAYTMPHSMMPVTTRDHCSLVYLRIISDF